MEIVVIGAGYMAKEHVKAFRAIKGVNIRGVHSRTLTSAIHFANELSINKVYGSFNEIIEDANIDALVIAVPELSLPSIIEAISSFPVPCLIEKPIGLNYEVSIELTSQLQSRPANSFVALNRRFYSSTLQAKQFLENEQSEKNRIISIRDQGYPLRAFGAGQPIEVCRNWMFANSVHIIDYFRMFGRGEITNVITHQIYNPKNPFYSSSSIEFASGDLGTYECVWNAPSPWSVAVQTTESYLELKPLESGSVRFGNNELVALEISDDDLKYKAGLLEQAKNFTRAVAGLSHDCVKLDDALNTMLLVSQLYGDAKF